MLGQVWKRGFATTGRTLQEATKSIRSKSYGALFNGVNRAEDSVVKKKTIIPNLIKHFPESTIYDPFDFSLAKINLEKKIAKDSYVVKTFDIKKLNPLDFYTNPRYLSQYLTSSGRILSRDVTKLSLKNQKRLAKAVKRARSAGLLSSVHKHVSFLLHT